MASPTVSTGSTKVDAAVQKVAAAAPGQLSGASLYSRFALAGAVCCSVTHGGLTPVDVYVASPVEELCARIACRELQCQKIYFANANHNTASRPVSSSTPQSTTPA